MVSATQLSSYLYCPRKLFISSVLKLETPPKEELVKGKTWHATYELINNNEEKIICAITKESKNYMDIFEIYRINYSKFLRDAIIKNKTDLKRFNISLIDLFKEYWPKFEEEAKNRALNTANFISKHDVYGKDLWNIITPKILSEKYYKSDKLNLSGIIDMIEIYAIDGTKLYLPIELKTGKIPSKGMWDGHRIQLAAYIMLLEDFGFKSTEGVLQYDGYDRRTLQINTLLREEVMQLIKEVDKIITNFNIPDYVDNKNKCKTCNFKEVCYNNSEIKALVEKTRNKFES